MKYQEHFFFWIGLMLFKRYHFFCLSLFISTTVLAENQHRLLPVDEANRDLSFVEFRQQLKTIIQNRDPEGFLKFVSPQVSGSKDKRGISHFVKIWEPQANDSELWPTMENIVNMGGGFVRSERGVTFCAPYIFTNFPDDLDIYGHGVIIGDKVPLKSAPLKTSQNLASLSYDLLKVEDWRSVQEKSANQEIRWIKVSTMDGRKGYVDKKMVRSPTDYAACFLFTPKAGWKIVSLVSNE